MAQLSDHNLFRPALPEEWRPLLEHLSELDRLAESEGGDETPSEENRRKASALRRQMLQARLPADDLPPHLGASSPTFRRCFSEAVLLWPLFGDSCGKVLLDTLKTGRPPDFRIDLDDAAGRREALRLALTRMFGWTPAEIDEIETHLSRLTSNLQIKRAITKNICAFFESRGGSDEARSVEFMLQIYGPLPWRPGDVDFVITASEIFPCIPYKDTVLTHENYAARPAAEREQIAEFLRRVHKEEQTLSSVRFPAFGLFDLKVVSPEFVGRLVEGVRREPDMSELSAETITGTLTTMVTILPTSEVNRFLIHDAMGHAWQETLCEFERLFGELAGIDDPLHDWGGAFAVENGKTVLLPDTLSQVVEKDLRRRIAIGLNVVISESLADIVEHKFARFGSPLSSSSLLPECPLRIDLTLKDAKRMTRLWGKPYRRLIQHPEERERLSEELEQSGFPRSGMDEAIAAAVRIIDRDFGMALEDDLTVRTNSDGGLRANVLQRVMASMITFDDAVERFLALADARYAAREDVPVWRRPAACIDLLVLTLAWFYEQERALNVWHIDELLNNELGPAFQRLEEALEG